MKIRFYDHEYCWTHGKIPKGRGTWMFSIEGEWYEAGCLKTLTEAKKEVREYIKKTRPDAVTVAVTIMP